MSEMIDQAARALMNHFGRKEAGVADVWADAPDIHRAIFRHHARICIDAMREPTGAMVEAGDALQSFDGDSTPTEAYWSAMIAAALSEEPKP